jgi:hypothetical protein
LPYLTLSVEIYFFSLVFSAEAEDLEFLELAKLEKSANNKIWDPKIS